MTSGTTKSADTSTTGSVPASVEGGSRHNALWWAKVHSAGPMQVSPDTPAVAGLTRAAEPDGGTVWMLPTLPDGAGHGILEELGAPPVAVEQPNETARVLAICVTCCWPDRSGPAWPGVTGTLAQIKAVYAGLRGRPEQSSDLTLIIGSLRRLHATSWLIWNEKAGEVRLGPRVVAWGPNQLAVLREICRILLDPPRAVVSAPRPPEFATDGLSEEDSAQDAATGLSDGGAAEETVAEAGEAAYGIAVEDNATGDGTALRVGAGDGAVGGGTMRDSAEHKLIGSRLTRAVSADEHPTDSGTTHGTSAEKDPIEGGPEYGVEDHATDGGATHGLSAEDELAGRGSAHGKSAGNNSTDSEAEYGAGVQDNATASAPTHGTSAPRTSLPSADRRTE